jgi:hypothetical protein
MTKAEFAQLEIGDKVNGFGWSGQPITGVVVGINRRNTRATVRGGGSMMTVNYKKLTLIERDPSSRYSMAVQELIPHLERFLAAVDKS